ncbi:MAG: transporter, partial [Leptospiraceae bacterium]|nr:transporter [Leptospiraceae bacterium]
MNRFIFLFIFQLTTVVYSEELDMVLNNLIETHPEIQSIKSELKSKRANAEHDTTYPDPKIGVAFRNYPTRSYSLNDRAYDTPSMTGIEYSI